MQQQQEHHHHQFGYNRKKGIDKKSSSSTSRKSSSSSSNNNNNSHINNSNSSRTIKIDNTMNNNNSQYYNNNDDNATTNDHSFVTIELSSQQVHFSSQQPPQPPITIAPLIGSSQHLLQPNGSILGRHVAATILPQYPNLLSVIPISNRPALEAATTTTTSTTMTKSNPSKSSSSSSKTIHKQQQKQQHPQSTQPMTHSDIRAFCVDIGTILHEQLKIGRGHRVAIVLPNGPELALSIFTVSCYCSVVPLNALSAIQELESDLCKASIDHVIALDAQHHHDDTTVSNMSNTSANPAIEQLCLQLNIPFTGLIPDPSKAGSFRLRSRERYTVQIPRRFLQQNLDTTSQQQQQQSSFINNHPLSPSAGYIQRQFSTTSEADRSAGITEIQSSSRLQQQYTEDNNNNISGSWIQPNQHDDEVLVLFTSGTTGSKKLVPHTLANVLVGTACIAVSWKLTPSDVNVNLMPLFHIGGILRQVYSPILSGGCVICCPSFDPSIFWNLLSQNKFTWYYAAPTMHQIILATGRAEGYIADNSHSSTGFANSNNTKSPTLKKTSLRMIANAAGGLLPATARELRQAFHGANILPSYGMTECMPITSPPANYQLEKPGTSGVAVGPEIAILDTRTHQPIDTGNEGMICVRGDPCFQGYGLIAGENESSHHQPQTSFLHGGWFNTGDLGYLDTDGYLYITGRSKEVINRGGEIISPMEVEEAIMEHPAVLACVAFSTSHSVLQEVVGLLLVPAPNRPHIDLPGLHDYLGQGRLATPKWPQCLVYCDALPKSFTNKVLRVKLGQRLTLPELNDSMYWIERTFKAKCPPQGTDVSVAIPCERVAVSAASVQQQLRSAMQLHENDDLVVVPHAVKIGALVAYISSRLDRLLTIRIAQETLHGYLVPTHVCVCSSATCPAQLLLTDQLLPPQPSDAIGSILQEENSKGHGPADPLVMEIQDLMQHLLDLDCAPSPDTSFFNLGGSSMLASQLASKIRKQHAVQFSGAEVFHASTCNAIAAVILERRGGPGASETGSESAKQASLASSMGASALANFKVDFTKLRFDTVRLEPQSSFLGLLVQLLPLLVIYPLWQLSRLFLFFRILLSILHSVPGEQNLVKFLLTLVIFHALWVTITPLIFVALKWLIVGKYRQGRYALWSNYYLRWWFVDVMRKLIGRGSWGAHPETLNLYYRLLGAKIGTNAKISVKAEVAEYDLVSIGDNAAVELSTVRGFGVDNGCMILGEVKVGNRASVGIRSVVAPFTQVPDDYHLAPLSSSYEISTAVEKNQHHLRYNRHAFAEPNMLASIFLVSPITFLVDTFSHVPAFLVLYWMLTTHWKYAEPFQTAGDLIEWLANPKRVPFYIGIRIVRAVVAPIFYMIASLLVKWCVIGKFREGPRNTSSQWQLIRHSLAATLFSREKIQDVTDLIGRHYELVSVLYRLLGAKVGKRVFWPGRQPVFTGEFDLLEIGDDVVFGSRSTLICTTVDTCEKIILCAGSNISDNTVVLPGSVIGKGAVLGSNSVCPEGWYLPESSIWLGVRDGNPILLEKGVEDVTGPVKVSDVSQSKFQMDGDATTIRPFGRAFYQGDANYFVLPLLVITIYTFIVRSILATIGALPVLSALHLAAGYFYGWPISNRSYHYIPVSSMNLYLILLGFFMFTHLLHVLAWLVIDISSKWIFMGRRKEGRYNYDTSSYAQRWELYQILTRVRDLGRMNFLDFICGTPFMSTFFRWLGCTVGHDTCLYPAGFEPMMPEPDLVTIGDHCVIDCASVVCHLNTRGNFELAAIAIDNNVTLRTGSRIQQAVVMETGSMLLEKSLAMTGEVIEADSVWLGSPAARLFSYDTSSIGTRPSGSDAGSQHGERSTTGGEYV